MVEERLMVPEPDAELATLCGVTVTLLEMKRFFTAECAERFRFEMIRPLCHPSVLCG